MSKSVPVATTAATTPAKIPREASKVMTLARLGSMHQCRLSFTRVLLRRLKSENWRFERSIFEFDEKGVGQAVYTAIGPERSYSLVCLGHDLKPEERSDRVIAHKWDSTFTLFDGIPTPADIQRLAQNIPKQEAGRISYRELCLSRANRSVRLFNHVLERLSAGQQPDTKQCLSVGYLMRTTAVYGSGKFGAADREFIADRAELSPPFQAEMLSVFLTRAYTLDLVEHMAHLRAPNQAVKINPELRQCFGVGNSTGLGLAPFIVNHPVLLNNWIAAREEALRRVCALEALTPQAHQSFCHMVQRACLNAENWQSEHLVQIKKVKDLRNDLKKLQTCLETEILSGKRPWQSLYDWAEKNLSLEGQEQLVSLMFEPYGELVDELHSQMKADETHSFAIDGAMPLSQMQAIIEKEYGWALKIDWAAPENQARAWYISAEKLEPRIGERFKEKLTPFEQPLAPGRDASQIHQAIQKWQGGKILADFLLHHPEHRFIARRIQIIAKFPYAEIRDNTISKSFLPIDMLRCKLAFFGATHFDPRSDRWLRINMFKDAPFPHNLHNSKIDDWSYPHLDQKAS